MSDMKFLIVDDFSTMRRIVRNLLKELGYTSADEAENGIEALAKLKSGSFHFVITDINMPEMDGFTLTEKIRADPALSKLPVLLVTAEARKEDIILASKIGANGYIVKPFTKASLDEKIAKIMQNLAASM